MKKTLTLLVATSAFAASLGLPTWSATPAPLGSGASVEFAAPVKGAQDTPPLVFVSDDEDHGWFRRLFAWKDDDDDDDGACDDNKRHGNDDDNCRGSARNPAPAGSVAPPKNGLFGTGTPPKVQMN